MKAGSVDPRIWELRATLDSTEAGILMYDHDLIVRVVNRPMAEWFGLDPTKVIGQRIRDVAHEFIAPRLADPSKLLARIDRLAEHPSEVIQEEVEVVQPEYRVYRLFIGPVQSDHMPIGHIDVYTDITDVRLREAERQALGHVAEALVRERTLERIAEVVVEQGSQVLRANSVALFLADNEREELRLLAYRGLSPDCVAELNAAPFSAPTVSSLAARTGRPQEVPDVAVIGSELAGARRIAEREGRQSVIAQPLLAKEQLLGVISLAMPAPHQITPWEREFVRAFADLCATAIENARLYDGLTEMLELREEFISAAAHELKTPVTTIKGYVQAMLKLAPEERAPREGIAFEVIDRQCDRIAGRVREMIEAVRLRRAAPEPTRVRFDMSEIAGDVVREVQTTTQGHALTLKREARAPVEADRERIEEVLVSMLDNAIKFSPNGGEIEVMVSRKGKDAVFSVQDHGVGISKARQPHIFEPFYEPVPAGAPGYRNVVALSLHLAKLIVERQKGRIWFESEEGKGSIFYFSLPIVESANG